MAYKIMFKFKFAIYCPNMKFSRHESHEIKLGFLPIYFLFFLHRYYLVTLELDYNNKLTPLLLFLAVSIYY